MKKVIIVFSIILILFLSYKGYMYYYNNNIMGNEFGLNLHFKVSKDNYDDFFGLKKGTYSKGKYHVVLSFYNENKKRYDDHTFIILKKNGYNNSFRTQVKCIEKYEPGMGIRVLNKKNTSGKELIVRLIPYEKNQTFPHSFRRNIPKEHRVTKTLKIKYGKVNTFVIDENGVTNPCN